MDRNEKAMEATQANVNEKLEYHDLLTGASGTRAVNYQGIGWAIKQLHHGLKARRRGWNGRGMWIELQVPDRFSKMTLPYVFMRTAQGDLVPWLCSQTDVLAMDWEIATAE